MIDRRLGVYAIFLTVLLCGGAGLCATVPLAPPIPDTGGYKDATSLGQNRVQIAGLIAQEMNTLQAGDGEGFRWLIHQITTEDGGQPSQFFLATYGDELNKACLKVLADHPDKKDSHIRLDIAIVASGTAKALGQTMIPTILQLLNDSSQPAVEEAEKAAGAAIATGMNDLQFPDLDKLVNAMVDSAAKPQNAGGTDGGFIAEDTYNALNLPSASAIQDPQHRIPVLIDGLLKLKELRLKMYTASDSPPNPTADNIPLIYIIGDSNNFANSAWSTILTQQQKLRAMQEAADLIYKVGVRAQNDVTGEKVELIKAIRQEATDLQNLPSSQLHSSNLNAWKDAIKLVAGMTADNDAKTIDTQTRAVVAAIRTEFPGVHDPMAVPVTDVSAKK